MRRKSCKSGAESHSKWLTLRQSGRAGSDAPYLGKLGRAGSPLHAGGCSETFERMRSWERRARSDAPYLGKLGRAGSPLHAEGCSETFERMRSWERRARSDAPYLGKLGRAGSPLHAEGCSETFERMRSWERRARSDAPYLVGESTGPRHFAIPPCLRSNRARHCLWRAAVPCGQAASQRGPTDHIRTLPPTPFLGIEL